MPTSSPRPRIGVRYWGSFAPRVSRACFDSTRSAIARSREVARPSKPKAGGDELDRLKTRLSTSVFLEGSDCPFAELCALRELLLRQTGRQAQLSELRAKSCGFLVRHSTTRFGRQIGLFLRWLTTVTFYARDEFRHATMRKSFVTVQS